MEFLKNIGRGLLVIALFITAIVLIMFLVAVVLTFNDWLYYSHSAMWPIFWGTVGTGLLVIVIGAIGKANRNWTGG